MPARDTGSHAAMLARLMSMRRKMSLQGKFMVRLCCDTQSRLWYVRGVRRLYIHLNLTGVTGG